MTPLPLNSLYNINVSSVIVIQNSIQNQKEKKKLTRMYFIQIQNNLCCEIVQ